jgi:hypothetical protein
MTANIRKIALLFVQAQQAMRDWREVMALYSMPSSEPAKHKRPKWGQPGRHRVRKARRAARAKQAAIQKLRHEIARGG